MKIIIGVDPGVGGGIAILNGKYIALKKMPETPADIYAFFNKFKNVECICYLEKVGGMSNNGGSRAFNFGCNYGHLTMALIAIGISTITVTPQKWQKHFQLGTKSSCATNTIWKNKLKATAQRLFPKNQIFLWGSDAVLISTYGAFMEKQNFT